MEKRKSLIAEEVPDPKRRRKQDLNTRYDRMIETMQMTRIYPKERTSTDKAVSVRHSATVNHHRKISGHLPENALCKAKDSLRRFHLDDGSPLPVNLANGMETVSMNRETLQSNCLGQDSTEPLPQWLAHTFATLPRKHPLRSLLPKRALGFSSPETHQSSASTKVNEVISSPESEQLPFTLNMAEEPTSPSTLVATSTYSNSGTYVSNLGPHRIRTPLLEQLVHNSSVGNPSETEAYVSPDFRLFTTPGPASTISRPFTPPPISITGIDVNMFPSSKPPAYDDEVHLGEELISGLPAEDTVQEEPRLYSADSLNLNHSIVQSQYGSISDVHDSDPAVEFSEFKPADKHLYFGAPTEGFSKPDPSLESYSLDVETLDFRWTVFDRSNLHQQDSIRVCTSSLHQPGDVGPELFVDLGADLHEGCKSPSSDEDRFYFQATPHKNQTTHITPIQKAFAPIQGISPLKESSSDIGNLDMLHAHQQSQCSQDSIETWSD